MIKLAIVLSGTFITRVETLFFSTLYITFILFECVRIFSYYLIAKFEDEILRQFEMLLL